MASATTFIATTPDGVIHTRTSKTRAYTHCVAVRDSYTHDLREAAKVHDVDRKNFLYTLAIAEGRITPGYQPTEAQIAAARAQASETVVAHSNADAYARAMADQRVARVEAKKAAGHYDRWGILGWNGRLDLAIKLAHGEGSHPRFADRTILQVSIRGPRGR